MGVKISKWNEAKHKLQLNKRVYSDLGFGSFSLIYKYLALMYKHFIFILICTSLLCIFSPYSFIVLSIWTCMLFWLLFFSLYLCFVLAFPWVTVGLRLHYWSLYCQYLSTTNLYSRQEVMVCWLISEFLAIYVMCLSKWRKNTNFSIGDMEVWR